MPSRLGETISTILAKDPAARSRLEVLLLYPSVHAQAFHGIAHVLYRRRIPLLPRALSQLARWCTGIEIHPGAQLGRRLFIDHGMGVVIGETAIIGDDCLIYHGVTLGGTGKETGKRHPTLGHHVVVGAGAKILGNILIGDGSRIGANSVVLRDVPSEATVVGIPGRVVVGTLRQAVASDRRESLPDPEAEAIKALADRLYVLETRLNGRDGTSPASSSSIGEVDDLIHGAGI